MLCLHWILSLAIKQRVSNVSTRTFSQIEFIWHNKVKHKRRCTESRKYVNCHKISSTWTTQQWVLLIFNCLMKTKTCKRFFTLTTREGGVFLAQQQQQKRRQPVLNPGYVFTRPRIWTAIFGSSAPSLDCCFTIFSSSRTSTSSGVIWSCGIALSPSRNRGIKASCHK